MFSLNDLLGGGRGQEAINQMSQMTGADQSAVSSVVSMALPTILNGLANNAQSPQGAEALNNALERDHDGSVLDNLGSLGSMIFGSGGGGQYMPQSRQADAGGILSHIFGSNQGQVASQISQQSGVGTGQVAQILMMLAPLVMGYLARQKQTQQMDAGGLSSWLGGQQAQMQSSGNPMVDMASRFLDRDGDGSMMDDLASMALGNMFRR